MKLLDGITARGDLAAIVDRNGAHASMFCEACDVILIHKIAHSIVPDGRDQDAAWQFYSQALIAAVMRALIREGHAPTAALVEALSVWPAERLAKPVAGTAAAGPVRQGPARPCVDALRGVQLSGLLTPVMQVVPLWHLVGEVPRKQ